MGFRIMNEQPALLKQKYQRLREIFALARQRYLEAGGNPHRPADNRYLTNEERQEAFELGTQVFEVQVNQTVAGKREQV
jgi:hypothetical protein